MELIRFIVARAISRPTVKLAHVCPEQGGLDVNAQAERVSEAGRCREPKPTFVWTMLFAWKTQPPFRRAFVLLRVRFPRSILQLLGRTSSNLQLLDNCPVSFALYRANRAARSASSTKRTQCGHADLHRHLRPTPGWHRTCGESRGSNQYDLLSVFGIF